MKIYGNPAHGLDSISMHWNTLGDSQPCEFLDRLDATNLIVSKHQGDKTGPVSKPRCHVLSISKPLEINRTPVYDEAICLEPANRLSYRRMLERATDNLPWSR